MSSRTSFLGCIVLVQPLLPCSIHHAPNPHDLAPFDPVHTVLVERLCSRRCRLVRQLDPRRDIAILLLGIILHNEHFNVKMQPGKIFLTLPYHLCKRGRRHGRRVVVAVYKTFLNELGQTGGEIFSVVDRGDVVEIELSEIHLPARCLFQGWVSRTKLAGLIHTRLSVSKRVYHLLVFLFLSEVPAA